MRNHPVHWCDGMYLVPQHFQAADRHWQELRHWSTFCDQEYHYGLRRLALNEDGLPNFHLEIDECLARTREGTLLVLQRDQQPERTAVKSALSEATELHDRLQAALEQSLDERPVIRVYIGLPKLKWGSVNVARDAEDGLFRFRELTIHEQDESFGGNDQEIALKALKAQIVLSTDDLSNFELLSVAQLKRGAEGAELDEEYIPPLLSVDAWPPLHRGILRRIYESVGNRIEVLSENVAARGINWAAQDPAEAERLVMLSVLNEAYTTLAPLVFSRGVHPFLAYRELCRVVGRMSILHETRRPPEDLPSYDHDNLGTVFRWFRQWILDLLVAEKPQERIEQEWFHGEGLGMAVTIKNRWLSPDWEWYVGVHHTGLSQQECQRLLAPNRLHWKLGSQRQVEYLFSNALPGLELTPLERTPAGLPIRSDWTYYEVTRSPRQIWEDVVATCTLGMRYREELIENRSELSGKRLMVVNLGNGRLVNLEFALFAASRRS